MMLKVVGRENLSKIYKDWRSLKRISCHYLQLFLTWWIAAAYCSVNIWLTLLAIKWQGIMRNLISTLHYMYVQQYHENEYHLSVFIYKSLLSYQWQHQPRWECCSAGSWVWWLLWSVLVSCPPAPQRSGSHESRPLLSCSALMWDNWGQTLPVSS